jgi:predicted DNA-binding antitoxin AbrB/MazE fold protein
VRVIEARYEEGVLRPQEPLALRSGELVNLIVVRRPDPKRWDLKGIQSGGAAEDLALAEEGLDDWADVLDREDRG